MCQLLASQCYVGALAKAVKSRPDLHFGLYFSQYEWFNPYYLQDKANNYTTQTYVKVHACLSLSLCLRYMLSSCVQEVSQPQLQQIINEYEPELIWSDGDWDANYTYWNSTQFLAWLYNERSGTIDG